MEINMEHIINVTLAAIAVGLIGFLGRKLYKGGGIIVEMVKAIAMGIKALLHYRIRVLCEEAIERKSLTSRDLKDIEYMYKPYKALKGNGTIDRLVEEVRTLPIVKAYKK